jgi:methane/ammonia monooxygenase subunit A
MLRDKTFKTGAGPVTESIPASPGIEGGAGSNPPVAAANVGTMGAHVSGSPFTSRAEAATAIKSADALLGIALFLIMIGGFHVHFMLTAGDWDFWVDWKDRRFWPTVLPIMLITFPAAAQYFFWVHFRLPFGATFLCLALITGEWIDRFVSFWGWTFFPITLCWPTSIIPMALYLDIVLLLSKSWIVTAIVGSMGFSLLMYSNNWVILAPFHQASEQYGQLMSVADLVGFHYVRTSMPEYIRIIERGTMRTFGKDVVGVSSFFSGFVSIIVYFVWWNVGKMFSTVKYMATI